MKNDPIDAGGHVRGRQNPLDDERQQEPFPIIDISARVNNRPEMLGTKEKFWVHLADEIQPGERPHLFKMGRANTGENWAEKVTSEFAFELGIPTARYELAVCRGERGVLTEQFFPNGAALFLGNYFFAGVEKGYDGEQRFKQIRYRLSTALNLVKGIDGLRSPSASRKELRGVHWNISSGI